MVAGTAQQPLLGENVARAEFRGAGEGEVFAHSIARERSGMPGVREVAAGLVCPIGTARRRYCFARYSATAPARASQRASPVRGGSSRMVASCCSAVGAT